MSPRLHTPGEGPRLTPSLGPSCFGSPGSQLDAWIEMMLPRPRFGEEGWGEAKAAALALSLKRRQREKE